MRRFATVFFAATLAFAAATVRSAAQNSYPSAGKYLESLEGKSREEICRRVDRLIRACADSSEAAKTAAFCYNHYLSSAVMGDESVALHIADTYFLNNRYQWPVEGGLTMVRLFAEFNRASMTGCDAPVLEADDPDGKSVRMPETATVFKAFYFYDTGCSECRIQTPLILNYLKSYDGTPLTFYAFFTQADTLAFMKAAASFDSVAGKSVKVVNLWDPEEKSDYHRKYAVLSTPQLFLADRQNVIVGRRLDCAALGQLLSALDKRESYDRDFYRSLFGAAGPEDYTAICETVDAVYSRCASDTSLFRDTFFSLYRFMRDSDGYALQKGAVYLAENYIIAKPGVWPADIIEQSSEAVELFNRNPLGEKAKDLFLNDRKGRNARLLDGRADAKVICFYDFGCPVCEAAMEDLKSMRRLLRRKGVEFTTVYVGKDADRFMKYTKRLPRRWRKLRDADGRSQMFDKYNLSSVPAIYLLDGEDRVTAKDINPLTLKQLVEKL